MISWYLISLCWKSKFFFFYYAGKMNFSGIFLFVLISLFSLSVSLSLLVLVFPSCFLFSLPLYQLFTRLHACFHKEGLPIRYSSVSSQHFSLPFFFFFPPLSRSFFLSSYLSSLKKFMDEISREILAIFNVFTRT